MLSKNNKVGRTLNFISFQLLHPRRTSLCHVPHPLLYRIWHQALQLPPGIRPSRTSPARLHPLHPIHKQLHPQSTRSLLHVPASTHAMAGRVTPPGLQQGR